MLRNFHPVLGERFTLVFITTCYSIINKLLLVFLSYRIIFCLVSYLEVQLTMSYNLYLRVILLFANPS